MVSQKVTFSHLRTQNVPVITLHTPCPLGNCESPGTRPTCPSPTHDIHEREQVLLHVLLPVELDHGVIYTQQDLDVVVVVGSVPACPMPRAVHVLLQDAQAEAEAVQAAGRGP